MIIEGHNKSMGRNSTLPRSAFCSAFLSLSFFFSPDFGEQENLCLFHVEYCVPAQYVSLLCPSVKEFSIMLVEGKTGSILSRIFNLLTKYSVAYFCVMYKVTYFDNSSSLESILQSPIKKRKHYFKVLLYPL
jgi:hypothetical protein